MAHSVRMSAALQKKILDSGFADAFDTSGIISIYTGTQPDHADSAYNQGGAATLLGTLTLAADAITGAAAGTTYANCKISFASITSDTSADASGTATWFRMSLSADQSAGADATKKRLDGSCGVGSTYDMNFDNATIVAGGTIACSAFELDSAE